MKRYKRSYIGMNFAKNIYNLVCSEVQPTSKEYKVYVGPFKSKRMAKFVLNQPYSWKDSERYVLLAYNPTEENHFNFMIVGSASTKEKFFKLRRKYILIAGGPKIKIDLRTGKVEESWSY